MKHQNSASTLELPVGAVGPVGADEVRRAAATLKKYRQGKAALEQRIIENERWFRMHHTGGTDAAPDSAWLFNSLASRHADAMDNYPEPNVLPRAADDEQAARQLSQILPVALEQNDYEQVYSDAWWYKLKHGAAVKGVFWNPAKAGGLGDIDIRLVDLLNLYWEPGVTDIQASREVFHVELADRDLLRERWPFAARQNAFDGPADVARYLYDDTVDTTEKCLVVDWYYKRGGKLHYCKFAGDTVLYASENDPAYAGRGYYDHGRYPFVFDVLYPIAGSPAGFGCIDLMKGCQQAIDSLGRAILKNADAAARVRYFVRGDGAVNEEEFADLDRSFVHVDGNLGEDSIRQITVHGLDDIYVTILNNKITELKETSGNRDFAQGGTASGVTAASAIAALQESGSKLSRDMQKSAYRAFVKECYLCIELMRQFYSAPRCFRITGEDGGQEFRLFSNAALLPQDQGSLFGVELGSRTPVFDVTVVPAKRSTYSRLTQNETAKELYSLGFFDPARAEQSLACLDMMDFEGKDKLVRTLQERRAQQPFRQDPAQQAFAVQGGSGLRAPAGGEALAAAARRRAQDPAAR
ncbi:MAG: hypothetical protein ACI4OL_08475 [Gemmiger sp.]